MEAGRGKILGFPPVAKMECLGFSMGRTLLEGPGTSPPLSVG